jgi:spermidine synthase
MSELSRAVMPDGGELVLCRRGEHYEIRCNGWELMSSRAHRTEDALARLACADLPPAPRVLIGGLGMGFTLRAALDALPATARVIVAELVAEIIAWNRGPLAVLAGRPLDDPRVTVYHADVAEVMSGGRFDAILLDIDNGPATPVYRDAPRLYGADGLRRAFASLTPGGTLAVWSADRSPTFEAALTESGFGWRAVGVAASDYGKPMHAIYLASIRNRHSGAGRKVDSHSKCNS